MCLRIYMPKLKWFQIFQSNNPKPLIAKEDIICYKYYKMFKPSPEYKNFLYLNLSSIYQEYPVKIKTLPFKLEKEKAFSRYSHNNRFDSSSPYELYEISYGYHSFITPYSKPFPVAIPGYYCKIKCIIPKGTRYFKGKFNNNMHQVDDCYCSEELILSEVIL